MHDQTPQSPVAVEKPPQQEPVAEPEPTSAPDKGKWKSWWHDPNDSTAGAVNWKSWFNEDDSDDDDTYENPVHHDGERQQDDNEVGCYSDGGEHSDDDSRYADRSTPRRSDVPFADYCCRLCNVPGHWIQNCPRIETQTQRSSRPWEGYCCRLCNVPGHWIKDCPQQLVNSRAPMPRDDYCCRLCNVRGHWIRDCPTLEEQTSSSACDGAHSCKVCDVGFAAESQLTAHLDEHVTCPEIDCGFAATTKVVDEHFEKCHGFVSSKPKRKTMVFRQQPQAEREYCSACDASGHSTRDCRKRPSNVSVPPASYVCRACGVSGHWIQKCPLMSAATPPATYICALCNVRGHWKRDCERTLTRGPPPSYACRLCGKGGHWMQRCSLFVKNSGSAEYRKPVDKVAIAQISNEVAHRAASEVDDGEPVNCVALDREQYEFFQSLGSRTGSSMSDAWDDTSESGDSVGSGDNAAETEVHDTADDDLARQIDDEPVTQEVESTPETEEVAGDAVAPDAEVDTVPEAADVSCDTEDESVQDDAEVAQDDAEVAQDDAEVAQDDAEVAQDDAEVAQDDAEVAQDDAEVAQEAEVETAGVSDQVNGRAEDDYGCGASSSGDESETSTVSASAEDGIDIEVLATAAATAAVAVVTTEESVETPTSKSPNDPVPSSYMCYICHLSGQHWSRKCPKRTTATAPYKGYCCKLCNVPGHWLLDCPERQRPHQPQPESQLQVQQTQTETQTQEKVSTKFPFKSSPPASYVCKLCEVTGHFLRQCPLLDAPVPPQSYVCKACETGGHWLKDCPTASSPVPPPSYLCKMCSVAGHWVRDCPNMDTTTPPPVWYVCKSCNIPGHWIQKCPGPRETQETPDSESSESESTPVIAPVEADPKPWQCEPCRTGFAINSQLQAHISQHVVCPEPGCGYSAVKRIVVAHALHVHGTKPFVTTAALQVSVPMAAGESGVRVPDVVVRGKRFSMQEVEVEGRKCIVLVQVQETA